MSTDAGGGRTYDEHFALRHPSRTPPLDAPGPKDDPGRERDEGGPDELESGPG
ncbi:hypothetical protein [Streptomyces abyssalis]|uniref:hypothetical protein n=1 Tax=Streptomyces abyssalis TaxID=933944 RepID=UPI001495EE40|nr:hypothetical protein [Streptomyces abyssalis]